MQPVSRANDEIWTSSFEEAIKRMRSNKPGSRALGDVGFEELPEAFRGLGLRQEQQRRSGCDGGQIAGSFEEGQLSVLGQSFHE